MPNRPYHATLAVLPRSVGMQGYFARTAIVADQAVVQPVWVEPHHPEPKVDQHPYDQTVIVLSGTLELILHGTDRYVVEAGDCLYIPADVTHRATVLGDEPVHALDIFAPVQDRFLALAAHQLDAETSAGGNR